MVESWYLLAWWLTPGIGLKRLSYINQAFDGHWQAAWLASDTQWRAHQLPVSWLKGRRAQSLDEAKRMWDWGQEPHQHLITYLSDDYPVWLKELEDAPPVLMVRGQKKALLLPQLAMVGTRNPSFYGLEVARNFAKALAERGIVITSGLALGIDAAAHEGALAAGGRTIGVLGTGLDNIYPARHIALAEQIQETGALVSELPPHSGVRRENFPKRNRIISGLSRGVLVVEATQKSGSLITAHQALSQNREVFAVPGSIHNPRSKGTHALLRDGAKLVESVGDILVELPIDFDVSTSKCASNLPEGALSGYTEIKGVMNDDVTTLETFIERTGKPVHEMAAILMEMELAGIIRSVPGGYTLTTEVLA